MQLHDLSLTMRRKKQKRVGRGGKRGTTSGRGQKGQKARAGHRIRPASRDLFMRIPKLRGVKHRRVTPRAIPVNVGDLARLNVAEITPAVLLERGFVRRRGERAKVLGGGELKKAITVRGLAVSASARKKIEAAGGKVTDLVQKSEQKGE
jgi:large subunit ribosomal protein L15